MKDKRPVIVSACLLGLQTRYDGAGAFSPEVEPLLKGRAFVPVCPEQLGGLPTPRPKAAIACGSGADVLCGSSRVIDESGADVTQKFITGAQAVLKIARMSNASEALLKDKSPSCGVGRIYNGTAIVAGEGVTTALLRENGVRTAGF